MMRIKKLLYLLVCFVFLASCNLPNAQATEAADGSAPSGEDAVGTSVALTTTAKLTEIAASAPVAPAAAVAAAATATVAPPPAATEAPSPTPTFTFTPTPCVGIVTASVVVNVRSGPATAYDVVGNMPIGGTAKVAGRNDANTWWYIEFPSGAGGHAWVAGSVTTTSCLPTNLPVIAAPPLPPTATPTEVVNVPQPPVSGSPDLVASGMQWSNPAYKNQSMNIQVRVTNSGSAPAGPFVVVWLSNQDEPGCDWSLSGLAAGASKNLNCTFTYTIFPTKKSTFWVTLKVDTNNQVAESDEGNNIRSANNLVVLPQP